MSTQEKERKPGFYHVRFKSYPGEMEWTICEYKDSKWQDRRFAGWDEKSFVEIDESPITREKPNKVLLKTFEELIHVFEATLPSEPDKDDAELIERCKSVISLTPSKESEPQKPDIKAEILKDSEDKQGSETK